MDPITRDEALPVIRAAAESARLGTVTKYASCVIGSEFREHEVHFQFSRGSMGAPKRPTLIVQRIGWVPFTHGSTPFKEKPKRMARGIWEALEDICFENDWNLLIQSVMEPKLGELLTQRGYHTEHFQSQDYHKFVSDVKQRKK